MNYKNQTEAVLGYLKTGRPLSQEEAYDIIGTQRLGAIIYNLRHKMGFDIASINCKGKNRFGNPTSFVRYHLANTQSQIKEIEERNGIS